MTEKRELLAKAEEVFFASGVAGWSGDVQAIELPDLPGSRLIVWADGDWSVRDLYFVTDSSQESWGQTIICHKGQLIWRMIYWGEYPEEAIPLVKAALLEAYEAKEFVGGRGPRRFSEPRYPQRYQNDVNHSSSFSEFSGKELVIDDDTNQTLGWHQYRGGLLL